MSSLCLDLGQLLTCIARLLTYPPSSCSLYPLSCVRIPSRLFSTIYSVSSSCAFVGFLDMAPWDGRHGSSRREGSAAVAGRGVESVHGAAPPAGAGLKDVKEHRHGRMRVDSEGHLSGRSSSMVRKSMTPHMDA